MPFLVWLSKIASSPVVANLLIPSLSRALKEFFESRASKAEKRSAIIQAEAASKIEENEKRAEALREASRRLSRTSSVR